MRYAKLGYLGISVCVGLLSICSTGCMISPQHGENIGRIDDRIGFDGATTRPGERLEIQARRPGGDWERIADATSGSYPLVLESGTWYYWGNYFVRIPRVYWTSVGGGRMAAQVRTVSLDDDVLGDEALFTFEEGFNPVGYADVAEMWEDYGHGRSVTIYGSM